MRIIPGLGSPLWGGNVGVDALLSRGILQPPAGSPRVTGQPVPSLLDALDALEQECIQSEAYQKQAVRWPLSSCPLRVWMAPGPQLFPEATLAHPSEQSQIPTELLLGALHQWESATAGAITFCHLSGLLPPEDVDLRIEWSSHTTLGRDYEVGHTDRVIQGAWIQQCTITLIVQPRIDDRLNLLQRQQRLATTILHELGHALGLEHSENKQDVMYFRGWRHSALSENDIHRIRELYHLK